jgi:hypothetical protein
MTANQIIRKHYNLSRPVTDTEVIDELVSLRRKIKKQGLDDMDMRLVSALGMHPVTGKMETTARHHPDLSAGFSDYDFKGPVR